MNAFSILEKDVFFNMEQTKDYKSYWRGKNLQFYPDQQIIIKISPPRMFIRYKVEQGIFVDFEEFYTSIEEIQWMDEKKPTSDDLEAQLAEAWNFLNNEETLLGKERDDFKK